MDRFIPRDKLSKRAKKALDSKKRVLWNQSPVTRRIECKKTYNRKRALWQKQFPEGLSFIPSPASRTHPAPTRCYRLSISMSFRCA